MVLTVLTVREGRNYCGMYGTFLPCGGAGKKSSCKAPRGQESSLQRVPAYVVERNMGQRWGVDKKCKSSENGYRGSVAGLDGCGVLSGGEGVGESSFVGRGQLKAEITGFTGKM